MIDLVDTLTLIGVPSFVADRNGTFTWLNDAARTVFGDVEGRSFEVVTAPGSAHIAQREIERKARGVPATDYVVDAVMRDGSVRRVEISSVRIPSGDEAHAFFGIVLPGPPSRLRESPVELTPRQAEVLALLADGASTDQMADALHLSKDTVRNHVRHLLRALGAHSRLEAVAIAHARGMLGEEAGAAQR